MTTENDKILITVLLTTLNAKTERIKQLEKKLHKSQSQGQNLKRMLLATIAEFYKPCNALPLEVIHWERLRDLHLEHADQVATEKAEQARNRSHTFNREDIKDNLVVKLKGELSIIRYNCDGLFSLCYTRGAEEEGVTAGYLSAQAMASHLNQHKYTREDS